MFNLDCTSRAVTTPQLHYRWQTVRKSIIILLFCQGKLTVRLNWQCLLINYRKQIIVIKIIFRLTLKISVLREIDFGLGRWAQSPQSKNKQKRCGH